MRKVGLVALVVVALGALLLCASSCYTGNPPWPYDPTQPAGPFPRNYYVAPGDAGVVEAGLPPLPGAPPRAVTWCER
jgi:hypothetical protein